jgi:hypothetical protein
MLRMNASDSISSPSTDWSPTSTRSDRVRPEEDVLGPGRGEGGEVVAADDRGGRLAEQIAAIEWRHHRVVHPEWNADRRREHPVAVGP